MYGRDWRELSDYTDIEEYPRARQAWEFLRRKPAFRVDCEIIAAFQKYISIFPEEEINFYQSMDRHGSHLQIIHSVISFSSLTRSALEEIKELSNYEVMYLISSNPAMFLADRHGLEIPTKSGLKPPLPEEDIPYDFPDYFFKKRPGYQVVTGGQYGIWRKTTITLQPWEAAIIINLGGSITDQINGVKEQLQTLQEKIEAGEFPGKTFPPGGSFEPPEKRIHPDAIYGEKIQKNKPVIRNIVKYLRVLDAKEDGAKNVQIYKVLYPAGYKKHFKDKSDLSAVAKEYVRTPFRDARRLMNTGYTEIANLDASTQVTDISTRS